LLLKPVTCWIRDRYQLPGRLLLLSVSGNRLKLSEFRFSCDLDTSLTDMSPQLAVQGGLPSLTALLPPGTDLKGFNSAILLDRIRNWALAKSVAVAIDPDQATEQKDLNLTEELARDLVARSQQSLSASSEGREEVGTSWDNIFLSDDPPVGGGCGVTDSCVHHQAWSHLAFNSRDSDDVAKGGFASVKLGEIDRYRILGARPACGCLLLLPASQHAQAEALQAELSRLGEPDKSLDSIQVGGLVLCRVKVNLAQRASVIRIV
jgi:hypothetical protein